MSGALAILCPGQGAQHPAMFDMARTDARAAALLDRCLQPEQTGRPLGEVLADPALLYSNRFAQPLIVAASLAMWEALRDHVPAPALVAGYSIGELSAYGVAGALNAEDATALAAARAALMDDCLTQAPGQALIAVSGLTPAGADSLLHEGGFHVAIETGADSFIAGGLAAALPRIESALVARGARVVILPVEVASHTPYMAPAVEPFAQLLRQRLHTAPRMPVLSGIAAAAVLRPEDAIATLSRQITEKIRWMDCMDACAEAGITVALELGPGSALSRMLQARHPAIECRSVADFRSLGGILAWLAARAG